MLRFLCSDVEERLMCLFFGFKTMFGDINHHVNAGLSQPHLYGVRKGSEECCLEPGGRQEYVAHALDEWSNELLKS